MKVLKVILFIASAVLLMPLSSHADDDFYGIIESIPEGKIGTWVIGGRQIVVTERTQLDEDHDPLGVAARNKKRLGPQSSQFLAHIDCNQGVHRDHIICNWDQIDCNQTAIKRADPH
jgi:hypothetical protein